MIIKHIKNAEYFYSADNTCLCELLHPKKHDHHVDIPYSIAHAILKPGEESQPHRLKTSTEIYFILKGMGLMHLNDETTEVQEGNIIVIPPGAKQHIKNIGKDTLEFLCIVSPPWNKEDEQIE